MAIEYGAELGVRTTRNVFYSNGFLDQWSSAGITWMNRTDSRSAMIQEGAHHLDLMFSHPLDPPSVREVRALEMEYVQRWIDEWNAAISPKGSVRSKVPSLPRRSKDRDSLVDSRNAIIFS